MKFWLPFYIGMRYIRAKKRTHFISFISLASMIGIALGVMVLITVLSVMNGFDYEIHEHIFSLAPHVTIQKDNSNLSAWQKIALEAKKIPQVASAAPYINSEAMLIANGKVAGVMLNGVLPNEEEKVSALKEKIVVGHLEGLTSDSFALALGVSAAEKLNVGIGDKITIMIPTANITLAGVLPRYKRFTVAAIFHVTGGDTNVDSSMVYLNLRDAQKLLEMPTDEVTGLRLKVKSLYDAPMVANILSAELGGDYFVSDWTMLYGSLFKAIQMEKTMMFIILLFIIAVATFNLVATLVMLVTDKQSEIAILRTLGAHPKTIMNIFVVTGGMIGLIGTLAGITGGVLLALNATAIVHTIESYFHVHFISSSVYFIDYLPSKLDWSDVTHIGLAAILMSLLATLYPAWRAAKTKPAESLRYE